MSKNWHYILHIGVGFYIDFWIFIPSRDNLTANISTITVSQVSAIVPR